jgi:hypothetical protein
MKVYGGNVVGKLVKKRTLARIAVYTRLIWKWNFKR